MNDGDKEILRQFMSVRETTMALLRRVPDDFLDKTPPGESADLAHLFAHAGCSGAWWMHHVLRDGARAQEKVSKDKDELLAEMAWWRDRVLTFFEPNDGAAMSETYSFTDEQGHEERWSGRDRLLYFITHETHHHARLIASLRQMGFNDFSWPGC